MVEVKTLDELQKAIAENGRVLVKFTSPSWCVPCQRFKPHFDAASQQLNDVTFVSVDMDVAERAIGEIFDIRSVPTVNYYEDNSFVKAVRSRTVMAVLKELS